VGRKDHKYSQIILREIRKTSVVLTLLYVIPILIIIVVLKTPVYAVTTATTTPQNQIDANEQQITDLNQEIAGYQSELTKVGANKSTLQTAINTLNIERKKIETEITVTQDQINTTELQVQGLGSKIYSTQETIAENEQEIGKYFRNIQEDDNQSLLEEVLSSNSIDEALTDIMTNIQIQDAIEDQVHALQTQKIGLANSQNAVEQKQNTLTSQKESLTSQQTSLATTKKTKDLLLAETDDEQSKYEALLTAAQAQLTSFSSFAQNAGGSGLLSDQTNCDAWGCYYNQRDSAWGNDPLNGTEYRIASDGCLLTSMAMVMTHYGFSDVTPATINANPNNFAPYYPAYLLDTITVDGTSATRTKTTIDATLATGNPVIVGIYAYGGTHFVVLVSGSNGNYLMRDPYIANGDDINFTDHYSLKSIYEIDKVEISG